MKQKIATTISLLSIVAAYCYFGEGVLVILAIVALIGYVIATLRE